MDILIGKNSKTNLMIENSTLRVGGNTLKVWYGNLFVKIGDFFTKKGTTIINENKPRLVTNPSGRLINPFTLIVTFTVDTNQKFQIILQGDYKEKYKECENGEINITENELFMIINTSQKSWFKKE